MTCMAQKLSRIKKNKFQWISSLFDALQYLQVHQRYPKFSKLQLMLLLLCTHTLSCQCISIYGHALFPNLPCLSLFFLNLPCCISFFLSFPCWGPPLLAVTFPPSNFLFLSLLGVGRYYTHTHFYNNETSTQ